MKSKHYITALLLVWANFLFAQQGVKFTSSVSKSTIAVGEQFELTFAVNFDGENFTPPDLNDFQLLSGPNLSRSVAIINNSTTISNAYSYILTASKTGEYTIAPATIVILGRRFSTKPIKITVVKGAAPQQNSQAQRQNAPDNTVTEGKASDISKLLFIRAIVDKTSVYQGEQVVLSFRLYTRVNILQSQLDAMPDLNGFWNEDANKSKQPQQAKWRIEVYNGEKYNVADIKQTILFPEHSGNITIDPMQMTFVLQVPAPSRDIMDQFFGSYKQEKYKVKSLPVVVHVKALPTAGKPASFTGAVGSFKMDASVDKTELKANESLNYKVKVTGAGNIKLLKTLSTVFPTDFEKYDPKTTDSINQSASGVTGYRIYNYLLIPRHQGDFTIEPLKFSYFNPETGRYTTITSKAFPIKVNKGTAESNVTALAGSGKQDIKVLEKDIRYIKTDGSDISKRGDNFFGSAGYYLLLLLGPLSCFAAFGYRNWVRKSNSDIVKVKSRKAGRVAAKHLASAQKQLQANNTQAFYENIFKGLYGYLSDKLNIPYANLDKETIADTLKAKSVGEPLIKQLLDTLDLCEMARFAPVTHISKEDVFEKAKNIIKDIENEI